MAAPIGGDNLVGPGVGLQLSPKSKYAGRLLFVGYNNESDFVWFSDDGGETYHLSNTSTLLRMLEVAILSSVIRSPSLSSTLSFRVSSRLLFLFGAI